MNIKRAASGTSTSSTSSIASTSSITSTTSITSTSSITSTRSTSSITSTRSIGTLNPNSYGQHNQHNQHHQQTSPPTPTYTANHKQHQSQRTNISTTSSNVVVRSSIINKVNGIAGVNCLVALVFETDTIAATCPFAQDTQTIPHKH